MYDFSVKKEKLVNLLFTLCFLSIAVAITKLIGWHNILWVFFKDSSYYITATGIAATAADVLTSLTVIFIYLSVKKLRETEKTKKLYSVLLWIVTGETIFACISSIASFVIAKFYPDIIEELLNISQTLYTVNNIIYYTVLFLPLPFYTAILIKEKLDINWMIVGTAANMFLILVTLIIYGVRKYLNEGIHYMTNIWFVKKYPMLALFADNRVFSQIRGYFWIIGLIVLIIIYKKKFANRNAEEEI